MCVQSLGQRLEHHPLAGRDLAQARQLVCEERSGVGMGKQTGLLQDESAHRSEVVHRRGIAMRGEPIARDGVPQLRPLSEGEQRLVAAGVTASTRDREDLVGRQVRRRQPGGRLGERAVAAPVAAEHRQGDEHLGGEGDPAPVRFVAHAAGQRGQVGQRRVEEIAVGEHRSQSRGRCRARRRRPARWWCPRGPGPPAGLPRARGRPERPRGWHRSP